MKIVIYVFLTVQFVLFVLGWWQVFQESDFVQLCGVFNIVFNTVFGLVNIAILRMTRDL